LSVSPSRPDSISARRGREPLCIGDWVLYPELGVVRRDSEEQRLTGKALHVLLVLIDAGDSAVSRDELLDQVWGENYPADSVVSRAIADIRGALGESASEHNYIRTLPKFGYRLVAKCSPASLHGNAQVPIERKLPTPAIAAIVAIVVAAITWALWPQPESQSVDLRLATGRPLTSSPGLEHQPRIVPGGDWVIYAALRPGQGDWDLFRVSTRDSTSQSVAASPGVQEHGPAISPGGDEVAYVRLTGAGCDVVTQSIAFGVPEPVATCTGKFPTLVDWSPDGNWLAYTGLENDDADGYRRIYIIDPNSGLRRQLSDAVSPTGTDFYPRFSPSSRHVAFLRGEPQPDHRTTLWTVEIQSGIETRLTEQPVQLGGMTWIDESTLLYSSNEAGRFELRQISLTSGAETKVEAAGLIHPDYLAAESLFVASGRRSERDLVVIADGEGPAALASSTSDDHHSAFSPDESLVAFISRRSGYDEVWIIDINSDVARRLTHFDGATVRYPSWHPEGRRILFTVQTDAGERLYEVDIISGDAHPIGSAELESTMPRWLADGQRWVQGCRDESGWGICVASDVGIERIANGYFRPTPVSNDVIAAVDRSGALYYLSLLDGSVETVLDGLPNDGRSGWALNGQYLVYNAPAAETNAGRVVRRDMSSGAETILFEGPMPLADTSIDIGSRTGAILFTRFQAASDDLLIFEQSFARR